MIKSNNSSSDYSILDFLMVKYFLVCFLLMPILLSSCNAPEEYKAVTKSEVEIEEIIKNSEALFLQRQDVSKLKEAVATIKKARNPEQRNFEVEIRYAKFNYFLSKQLNIEKEADEVNREGYNAGLIASRLEPNKPDGFFWAGANLGEESRRNPITVGLKSIGEISELMNKVIAIQPNFQAASAFDALAQLEMATRVTTGNPEKAVEYLEKGLTLEKDNSYLYLHLAEALLALNKKSEAKKNLDAIFKVKPNPEFEVERIEIETKARKLLQTKF